MRLSIKVLATTALAIIAVALATTPAAAQLNSNIGTVTINANLPEALTVSLTNSTVTIPLTENTATNAQTSAAVGVTTAWVLTPGRTTVKVFIDSTSPTPLTNGTDTIPATSIKIGSALAGPYTALTAAGAPFGVDGAQIGGTTTVTGANRSSSRTDNVFIAIDTTFNAQLSAGTYTGTLNVQAQATP